MWYKAYTKAPQFYAARTLPNLLNVWLDNRQTVSEVRDTTAGSVLRSAAVGKTKTLPLESAICKYFPAEEFILRFILSLS